MKKTIFILTGPSGAGKTTLGYFLKDELGIPELVSHTTRSMRSGEVEGISYYFVGKETFDKLEKIEYSNYAGNHYCVSKEEVERKLATHDSVFVITDMAGSNAIKRQYPDNVIQIFITADFLDLIARMDRRGDSADDILSRVKHLISNKELNNGTYTDYTIINRSLDTAKEQLLNIVKQHRVH